MTLSENITKYRKQMGYTQDKLGELLGVTNQAVSKWELGISMPDVMLLPKIADVLGTTLNGLYGIEEIPTKKDKSTIIDEFPKEIQNLIKTHLYKRLFSDSPNLNDFVKLENTAENITSMKAPYTIGVVPYISGGASFISDSLSLVASDFEIQKGTELFNRAETISSIKKLCDPNVRIVLTFMYSQACQKAIGGLEHQHGSFDMHGVDFLLEELCTSCNLAEDETLDAIEKLNAIHLIDVSSENDQIKYHFNITKGIETAVIFNVLKRWSKESFAFGCGYIVGHRAW